MRIALYHNLTSGGSKREAYELTRQMAAQGHEIDLYCPATADEDFLSVEKIVNKQYIYPFRPEEPVRYRLPFLRKYLDFYKQLSNLRGFHRLSKQIAQDINSRKYDFAFLHHDLIIQSPFLLKYLEIPSVYYCAEPMRRFYEPMICRDYEKPKGLANRIQRVWYSPAEKMEEILIKSGDRKNISYAGLLLTNSFFSAESIYKAYGLRAQVSYLGVDEQKFSPRNIKKQNKVLSVGAISALKGYDFLIRSIALIPKPLRPELCIAGNTASQGETNFIRNLAKEKDVAVDFRVNVTEDELVSLYNQVKAFVYAPVMEPFGLAPLEAMACETPVAAVKEGGVRESVMDGLTGFLSPRVAEAFAGNLQKILTDETLAGKMGKHGREEILKRWTWRHAYGRFMKHVESFLSDKGSPSCP
jgi:glycosyltransferase involved in cell wall biosynthesis